VLEKSLLLEVVENTSDAYEVVVADDEFNVFNPIEDFLYGDPENSELQIEHKKFYKMKPISLDMLPPIDIIVYGINEDGR